MDNLRRRIILAAASTPAPVRVAAASTPAPERVAHIRGGDDGSYIDTGNTPDVNTKVSETEEPSVVGPGINE